MIVKVNIPDTRLVAAAHIRVTLSFCHVHGESTKLKGRRRLKPWRMAARDPFDPGLKFPVINHSRPL